MSSSSIAADTPKPTEAPAATPAKPVTPQPSENNKSEAKPAEQQK